MDKRLDSVKAQIIHHCMGHNKHFTEEYLSNLNITALMAEVHPNDRAYFTTLLGTESKENSTKGKEEE